jgi:murein L,D-transpeptidase YcbB/YkuD
MAYVNGRLPDSALAAIPGGRLRRDAARAWNAMCAEAQERGLPVPRPTSSRVAYRTLAEQQYFWARYVSGQGNLAARPGTSNHGWGLAVDVATPAMRQTIDRIGAKYGWAKKWSDAPGEWWHLKWREGTYAAVTDARDDPTIRKGTVNPAAVHRLQKLLRSLHLTNVQNGRYVYWTRRAVRRFQAKHHLPVDGVVGPKTWAALRAATNKH